MKNQLKMTGHMPMFDQILKKIWHFLDLGIVVVVGGDFSFDVSIGVLPLIGIVLTKERLF